MIKRACLLCVTTLSIATQSCVISTETYFDVSETGYNVYLYNAGSNLNGAYVGTTRHPLVVQQNDTSEPNSQIKHIYYLVNDITYSIDAEIHETIILSDCNISDVHINAQSAIDHSYTFDGNSAYITYLPETINRAEKFTQTEEANSPRADIRNDEESNNDSSDAAKKNRILSEIYDNYFLG